MSVCVYSLCLAQELTGGRKQLCIKRQQQQHVYFRKGTYVRRKIPEQAEDQGQPKTEMAD